ncbi:MAG: hypothetical protein MI923_11640 [Phycisphaerales bacterium]|nr:hypothetical protein [Phycisphaerales bacterium]
MAFHDLTPNRQTHAGAMIVPRWALVALQLGVGAVCFVGAVQLLLHGEGVGHRPKDALIARGIALIEILAVVLFWIPRGRRFGGILLILVLTLAAGFHVMIGEGFPLPLAAYASAVIVTVYARQHVSKVTDNDG